MGEVLRILFKLLSLIEYDYSVVDSTKLSDWLGRLHELFLDVRVRSGSTIFQYMQNKLRWSLLGVYLRVLDLCLVMEHSTLSPY